jgi:aquaporin Z
MAAPALEHVRGDTHMDRVTRYGAEFLGTAFLVFLGVGSAVAGLLSGGVVVVALAFGFALLALSYAIGPVSGAHVNPAVTLGALIAGRIDIEDAIGYWIAQFLGAIAGAFVLFGLTRWGDVRDQTGALGANGYGRNISLGGTMTIEILMTFVLVLVVLIVTARTENAGFAGLAIGITLGVCHLLAVPLDGTSVNPARSFGPAIFEGGTALSQLWVFLVFPLIGGVLAALAVPFVTHEGWHYRSTVEAEPAGSGAGASEALSVAEPSASARSAAETPIHDPATPETTANDARRTDRPDSPRPD